MQMQHLILNLVKVLAHGYALPELRKLDLVEELQVLRNTVLDTKEN